MDARLFFSFFQFCDVATIGDHLQEELAKIRQFQNKNSSKSGNFLVPFFQCKNPLYD
jgi:hypothetical protein